MSLLNMPQNEIKDDFIEITIQYIKQLYNYAYLITEDYGKASKLVFKTYKEAHSFYRYLSSGTKIKLWLFRIMNNVIIKDTKLKSEQRENISREKFKGQITDLSFTEVLSLIQSLPYNLKKLIALYTAGKFRPGEISEILDLPEGVVYKRLFDAREFLLKNLYSDDTNAGYLSDELEYSDKIELSKTVEKPGEYAGNKNFNNVLQSQLLVKETINSKLIKEQPPEELESRIKNKFRSSLQERLKSTSRSRRYVSYITVIMFILIAVLFLINKPSVEVYKNFAKEQIGKNNLLIQLQKNYTLLKNGKLNDKIFWGDSISILNYLQAEKIKYKVSFYPNENMILKGCFIISLAVNKFALLIYSSTKHENILLFPVQIDWVNKRDSIVLSKNLFDYLLADNCYSTVKENFISLLRINGKNIFAFATDLPAKNLILEICKKVKS